MFGIIIKTNIFRFCSKVKNLSLIKNDILNKDINISSDSSEMKTNTLLTDNLYTFSLNNNINYDEDKVNVNINQQEYGKKLFLKSKIDLKHILSDFNINEFKEGIKNNDYLIYDTHKNLPEVNEKSF